MSSNIYNNGFIILFVILISSGCSTTPNNFLQQSHKGYIEAESDPQIAKTAPVYLNKAQGALRIADVLEFDGGDQVLIEHYAYIANRYLDIAKEVAKIGLAEEQIKMAGETRKEVIYNTRLAEADQARTKLKEMSSLLKSLNGKQTERGTVVTLNEIIFDHNTAVMREGSLNNVKRLASYLKQNPNNKVLVEGFTDNIGSKSYNQKLSEKRAGSVRRALMNLGVEGKRIKALGYGERHPVSSNNTAVGQQRNRRVEVVVSDGSKEIPVLY